MTRLQRDFLGPFVECNGSINRPPVATSLKFDSKIVARNINYTPRVRVIDDIGQVEEWHACGQVSAYKEARNSLQQAEFERFAAMACGPEFSRNAVARALYPRMAALYPNGIDYLGADYRAHRELDERLKKAHYDRLNARYLAKRDANPPEPTGPAPVKLKVTTGEELLRNMGATPASTAAAPARSSRRRARP